MAANRRRHRYRTRSVAHVIEEIAWAQKAFPDVKEFFFDDDTFTDDLPRAEAIAKELSKLGVTWSCNAKANVPYAMLKVLRDNGLRLLLVGYESGNQQILHNITFIMGLPGETKETIRENRYRHQSAYGPGFARRPLSGHVFVQSGHEERLARRCPCRAR